MLQPVSHMCLGELSCRVSISMIIDSDSGNEMDDLFAITLALIDPRIELTALLSSHYYNHPSAGDSSVEVSLSINEQLVMLHRGTQLQQMPAQGDSALTIPVLKGAAGPISYWSDNKPQPSPAARFIIDQAKALDFKEKLTVVTLGSTTNLASAILMDTTIIPKIRWYAMGFKYDERQQVWNKNEFNVRNDLDAMDYLLNREGLETHIMTGTTSSAYTFERTETFDLLEGRGPKWDILVDRWKSIAPEERYWTMWDLALIQAMLHPELVTEKEVWGPPENLRKRIFVYTHLDEVKMRREFRRMVRIAMDDLPSDSK